MILCCVLAAGGVTQSFAQEAQPAPSPASAEAPAEDQTEINVKNADLEAVIRIFSKKTRRNYILDERVKGKVSIFLPGKIDSQESIRVLDSVLALKGFAAVPIGDGLWKIVPAKEARQTTIPTRTDSPQETPSASVATRLLTLKYVSADDVKQLVSQLVSGDGLVSAYEGTNSLMIIDFEDNIERIVEIIAQLDVPFSDRDMAIIPIEHADAKEIADKLKEILGENEEKKSDAASSGMDLIRARIAEVATRNAAAGGAAQAGQTAPATVSATGQTISARARAPKIIPDERTNSIIVVADEDTTARIRALISQLDSEIDRSGERFYVYRCQHAKAEDLAEVLGGLVGEGGSGSRGLGDDMSRASSASSSLGGRSSSFSSANRSNRSAFGSSGSLFGGGSSGDSINRSSESRSVTSVQLGENLSITADPATNSLIIRASKTDYMKITELLKKLDIKRRQVLVEAMLLEVGVDNQESMGMEFLTSTGGSDGGILAKSDFGNLGTLLSDPTQVSNFAVAAASAGTLKLPGDIEIPTQTVLLTAAKSNSNVNVLSAPTILTTDNEEAQIVVGQNIPFISSTSTSDTNLNNTFNQVERQDIGIKLRITPQISSRDFVTLSIFTEVSNVIAATLLSNLGPTTTIRNSETKVITKDGQMIVIGGLMSDDVSQAEQGVPYLMDVPVLGHLFRLRSETYRRTNLLIFITPRVVKDQYDARDITLDSRNELREDVDHFGHQPRRNEILANVDIDRVSESPLSESDELERGAHTSEDWQKGIRSSKPSTIREPAPQQQSAAGIKGDRSTPLEFNLSAPKAKLFPGSSPLPTHAGRHIVLQAQGGGNGELPFSIEPNSGKVGLIVPSDSLPTAGSYFSPGQQYRYTARKGLQFRALGIYNSREEALAAHPELGENWHIMSPYEVMGLGKTAWLRDSE